MGRRRDPDRLRARLGQDLRGDLVPLRMTGRCLEDVNRRDDPRAIRVEPEQGASLGRNTASADEVLRQRGERAARDEAELEVVRTVRRQHLVFRRARTRALLLDGGADAGADGVV